MSNQLPIYLCFLLFLVPAALLLACRIFRLFGWLPPLYLTYLGLLLPSALLLFFGIHAGIQALTQQQLLILGKEFELTNRSHLTIGSHSSNHFRLQASMNGHESFEDKLLSINWPVKIGQGDFRLELLRPLSRNVVSVDGLPIRALPLETGILYQISFDDFDFSQEPDKLLFLEIQGKVPVFQFRGQTFSRGFTRNYAFGLIRRPYPAFEPRHLNIGERILMPNLARESLLGQSSLIWDGSRYWLAANDAGIRLNGLVFPHAVNARQDQWITVSNQQLGKQNRSLRFRLALRKLPLQQGNKSRLVFEYSKKDQSQSLLPSKMKLFNLTDGSAYFSTAYEIRDPNFPRTGFLFRRSPDGSFEHQAGQLREGEVYRCGDTLFSILSPNSSQLSLLSWVSLLLLASALFVPKQWLEKDLFLVLTLASLYFCFAFRQLLAFRAWQGFPYSQSVIHDSFMLPFIFTALMLALSAQTPMYIAQPFFSFKEHRRALQSTLRNFATPMSALLLLLLLFGLVCSQLLYGTLSHPFTLALLLLSAAIYFSQPLIRLLELHTLQNTNLPHLGILLALCFLLILLLGLFGVQEVIPILGFRFRPDLFLHFVLWITCAFFCWIWHRFAEHRLPKWYFPFIASCLLMLIGLAQAFLASDFGFFILIAPPLLLTIFFAIYPTDRRLINLLPLVILILTAALAFFSFESWGLLSEKSRRLAFSLNPDLLKLNYFEEFHRQLPIVWSSNQGFFGAGFFKGQEYSELRNTAVNDNVLSVFIQGELGTFGTLLLVALFLVLSLSLAFFALEHLTRGKGFRIWFLMATAISLLWTLFVMVAGNLGYFPLTGKNLPFLGLDSINDDLRYSLLFGLSLRFMLQLAEDKDG